MNLLKICNRIIEYSFYGLFLLVPLVFTSTTSELFELNKMWLTWALTIIIGTAWLIKMILQRRILFQRTPLDIPIALFLASQIISTIFSWDVHVSIWGYYSRFNGGLLSIISYILLYYAFVTYVSEGVAKEEGIPTPLRSTELRGTGSGPRHSEALAKGGGKLLTGPRRLVKRLLFLSLISGAVVALWGLPSHFGYDPTCFLFRGTFDVSCWTADFMPKIRIFSTLGQPAWLAAYLSILIPITIALILTISHNHRRQSIHLIYLALLILLILFYVDLLYTRTRSGFLGIWIALLFFFATYIFTVIRNKKSFGLPQSRQGVRKSLLLIASLLLIITFIIGTPIGQLNRFTLAGIESYFQKIQAPKNSPAPIQSGPAGSASNATSGDKKTAPVPASKQSFESGGTESANIRLNVWKGAITIWKNNPLFGTGVETFAYAYYKYKPVGQNLTSEWNFLYNKAHNEYLNYLATTGIVGLGTYLGMIGFFLTIVILRLKAEGSQILRSTQNDKPNKTLILALLAGYISILITNFFGFSVVITNIYLFMIPAFVFILTKSDLILEEKTKFQTVQPNKAAKINYGVSIWQYPPIFFVSIIGLYMCIMLFRFWQADIAYALGYNLGRAGQYQQAYPLLHKAVELRGDEPVFKDELSINNAIIAVGLLAQEPSDNKKEQTISVASSLTQEAINTSNEIISQYTNNAVFWKTRVRLFYTLSQVDSRYLPKALDAIEKASLIAPNDANISYNLGVLYGQNNNITKGIEALEKTVKLKPDYRDARYALGLFYHTASLDEKGEIVIDSTLNQKAIAQMQYILKYISPQDTTAQDSIKTWGK